MATVLGPFFGDTPHEALADSMVRLGVANVAATLTSIPAEGLAWRAVVSREDAPGLRAVLLQGDDGWVVAVSSSEEPEQDLLSMTHTALAQLAQQIAEEAANPGA